MDHNLEPGILETNIALEAAEILELTKMRPAMTAAEHKEKLGGEMADVMWYLMFLAELHEIDLAEEVLIKLAVNAGRFPPEQFQGDRRDFLKQYWARKKDLGERK